MFINFSTQFIYRRRQLGQSARMSHVTKSLKNRSKLLRHRGKLFVCLINSAIFASQVLEITFSSYLLCFFLRSLCVIFICFANEKRVVRERRRLVYKAEYENFLKTTVFHVCKHFVMTDILRQLPSARASLNLANL